MRGGYLGHVLVFVIAVRYVICLFVCAVGVGCFLFLFCSLRLMELCCYLFRVVMYAWRFSWSCLGVCNRCSLGPVIICR